MPYTFLLPNFSLFFFFFNDTATTEIYTLSLHDALPISPSRPPPAASRPSASSIPARIPYWPNGSEAKLFGASSPDDIERLRAGGNRNLAWFEEYCSWRYVTECTDHANFGLRLGPNPRKIVSTTPKPIRQLKELLALRGTVVTTGTTDD